MYPCQDNETMNYASGKCIPIVEPKTTESKGDGSTSIWGYLPGILSGAGDLLSGAKGSPKNVTYIQGTQSGAGGSNIIYIGIGGIILLALAYFMLKPQTK